MNKNLTCNQVISLLEFYVSGEINPKLKEYVNAHILSCPRCKKKLEELKNILLKFDILEKDINDNKSEELFDSYFLSNLSAYVDNELDTKENIKIKKTTVSNPKARKKLEAMYKFQKLLQSSYEKTKKDYKKDFSKIIISNIIDNETYSTSYFKRFLFLFYALIFAILVCFWYLYF